MINPLKHLTDDELVALACKGDQTALRDHFAAMALSYLCSTPALDQALLGVMSINDTGTIFTNTANFAYRMADAMLKARAK